MLGAQGVARERHAARQDRIRAARGQPLLRLPVVEGLAGDWPPGRAGKRVGLRWPGLLFLEAEIKMLSTSLPCTHTNACTAVSCQVTERLLRQKEETL